jgi:hypothetical protein
MFSTEIPFMNWKIGLLDPSRHDFHLNFFNTHCICTGYTDNKENQIFHILENSEWSSCKVMTNGLFIYGEIFAHFLIYLEARPHI